MTQIQSLLIVICVPILVRSGCEDYGDIESCQNNAPCIWRQRVCFGRKNSSIKWYELYRKVECEYNDVNVTEPIDVRLSISNYTSDNNNSYNNCSELSVPFVENGPHYFVTYGTFDQCSFNTDYINSTSIAHVHVFCGTNGVWEPCKEFDYRYGVIPNVLRYRCVCGQLQVTTIPITVNYGGLSHHGYYTFNETEIRIDREYPICVQTWTLHLHL
eukprot:351530_1